MASLLADVNVQGHLPYLRQLIQGLGFLEILTESHIGFVTSPQLGIDRRIRDREPWNYCQAHALVLFTENRNREDENSLSATLQDSWSEGHFPVLTLANKGKFENSVVYAEAVATDVAELLYSIFCENNCDQPRIYVPLNNPRG